MEGGHLAQCRSGPGVELEGTAHSIGGDVSRRSQHHSRYLSTSCRSELGRNMFLNELSARLVIAGLDARRHGLYAARRSGE